MNASPRYVPFLPSFIQIGAENGDQGKGCFIVFEDEQEEEEESSMQKVEVVDEVNLQDDDPNDASSEDCIFRPLCYPRQLLKCSKWVGYISLLSLIVNLFFVVFGSSQSVFNTLVELFLLLVELLSILALFHGVAHQSPNYLQPFMFLE
uniref:Uncharacterized protein n=1 Tax=Ditylenchus dipsaci TaxID=166011 RepID=A0A915D9Q4_9BILA